MKIKNSYERTRADAIVKQGQFGAGDEREVVEALRKEFPAVDLGTLYRVAKSALFHVDLSNDTILSPRDRLKSAVNKGAEKYGTVRNDDAGQLREKLADILKTSGGFITDEAKRIAKEIKDKTGIQYYEILRKAKEDIIAMNNARPFKCSCGGTITLKPGQGDDPDPDYVCDECDAVFRRDDWRSDRLKPVNKK